MIIFIFHRNFYTIGGKFVVNFFDLSFTFLLLSFSFISFVICEFFDFNFSFWFSFHFYFQFSSVSGDRIFEFGLPFNLPFHFTLVFCLFFVTKPIIWTPTSSVRIGNVQFTFLYIRVKSFNFSFTNDLSFTIFISYIIFKFKFDMFVPKTRFFFKSQPFFLWTIFSDLENCPIGVEHTFFLAKGFVAITHDWIW